MLQLSQKLFSRSATDRRRYSAQEIELARLLKLPASELQRVRMGQTYHYRPFCVRKQDGRERQILAPSPALKELQQRLLRRNLAFLPVHPAATAFMTGASIARNARRHAGQALVATVDLVDFFSSTTASRVRDFFIRHGWRDRALSALMRLCVYQNGLPQGAPTSPCLSNLVNVDLDTALDDLARPSGATYTRYGDDLCFSWPARRIPGRFTAAVERDLLAAGYQVQPRKGWQIKRAADRPVITGLEFAPNGRIQPSKRLRAKMRRLRWLCWWRFTTARQAQQRGYDGFLNMLGT
jgi:hypothetical protein